MNIQKNQKRSEAVVAGFWRRSAAFLLDMLVLVAMGNGLAFILGDWFSSFGHWGRLVGIVVAGIYFGLLNSGVGKGQTLGKKWLKIAVVNQQGDSISVLRASLRYAIFGIPFFLSGIDLAPNQMQGLFFYLAMFVVLGPMLVTIYLYVFNSQTRQCLHDCLLGTYVVMTVCRDQNPSFGKLWQGHVAVVCVLFLIAAVAPYLFVQAQLNEEQLNILAVSDALQRNPLVRTSHIRQDQRTVKLANKPKANVDMITVDITLNQNRIEQKMLAQSLAVVLLRDYPPVLKADLLQVNLRYGFDIGIARGWQEMRYQFQPQALRAISEQ